MKRWLGVCVMVLMCGCASKNVSTVNSDYERNVRELKERVVRIVHRTKLYKDSLVWVRGVMEKSSNVADSTSYLETTYARSSARIWGGKLYHDIENKELVPSTVRLEKLTVMVHDTLLCSKIDTVYKEKKECIVKQSKKRWGDGLFYALGVMACIVALGSGIWFLYKCKLGGR